ncbi:MAG: hypothetical protein A3J79_14855 [Elusimicrobia bacterium RIFOXYB2_FULL_62_6]|nr:MAG: hypothetical protein A3J79_14855 [Elusimicrobia bacterium RIFOXYB2_FULL_62_6]
MPRELSKEFFAAYHAALFEAQGEEAAKNTVKAGIALAGRWLKSLAERPDTPEKFKAALEKEFKERFGFADLAEITFEADGTARLHLKGCDICPGNELLRAAGAKGCCPICHMVKSALGRSLGKRVELTGSQKPGPVGECVLEYKISQR